MLSAGQEEFLKSFSYTEYSDLIEFHKVITNMDEDNYIIKQQMLDESNNSLFSFIRKLLETDDDLSRIVANGIFEMVYSLSHEDLVNYLSKLEDKLIISSKVEKVNETKIKHAEIKEKNYNHNRKEQIDFIHKVYGFKDE